MIPGAVIIPILLIPAGGSADALLDEEGNPLMTELNEILLVDIP